jgi:trimethylamine--corrinoid protein Co-methyltransferase
MPSNTTAIPRLTLLDRQQSEILHSASLEILRRTGVRVHHEGALKLLRQTDARITDDNLVQMPATLVEWALRQVPSTVTLCRRSTSEPAVVLEGDRVHYGPGSDCPNYLDPATRQRRPFTQADVVSCIRLVDALPQLRFCMSMGIPSDVGLASPYRLQFALMLENTEKPIVFVCDDATDCEAIAAMAAVVAGGMDALRLNPTLLLYSEPTTPLVHTETATGKLLFMAEHGLPILHSPAPMMGGTAPMTLAGGLALGNAEVLSSLVIHQLQRPGAPFVYGVQAHHLDMRTTISVYGAPEYELARVASAELARFYGLPIWGNAGMSDSSVLDEQAAIDATFSIQVARLTGTHLAHDVGYLEAGLTTSPEMIVLGAEVISMLDAFAGGLRLDAESLALEVIHAVGPGGSYLAHEHTLHHFREVWQSALFNRRRTEDWLKRGGLSLGARLRDKAIALMDAARAHTTELPASVVAEIEYIWTPAFGKDKPSKAASLFS